MVELMISLVIGLIVVLAALSAYLGTSGAAKQADAQMRMNEDAQAALSVLAQQLRMAGANPKQPDRADSAQRNPVYKPSSWTTSFPLIEYAIRGCDSKFANLLSAPDIDQLSCNSNVGSHSLAVTYEASSYNTVVIPGSSVPTDCLGNPLTTQTAVLAVINSTRTGTETADIKYHVAENRYYIDTSPVSKLPSLYCRGNGYGATPHTLVENIEDLSFSYGVMPQGATATVAVAGYLDAQGLATAMPTLTPAERWARVASVRVCVVVRSPQPVAESVDSARYVRCDGTTDNAPSDRRLRKAFSTVVALRNRV